MLLYSRTVTAFHGLYVQYAYLRVANNKTFETRQFLNELAGLIVI